MAQIIVDTNNVYHLKINSDGSINANLVGTINITGPTTSLASSVASSATAVDLAAADTSRLALSIYNNSTQVLYVRKGTAAASTSVYSFQLGPQEFYEAPWPTAQSRFSGIWAAANGSALVTIDTA